YRDRQTCWRAALHQRAGRSQLISIAGVRGCRVDSELSFRLPRLRQEHPRTRPDRERVRNRRRIAAEYETGAPDGLTYRELERLRGKGWGTGRLHTARLHLTKLRTPFSHSLSLYKSYRPVGQ